MTSLRTSLGFNASLHGRWRSDEATPSPRRSPVEFVDQHGADLARARVVDGSENTARLFRQVLSRTLRWTENVILEHVSPSLFLALGAIAKSPQRMIEGVHGRRDKFWQWIPPIVDEGIEGAQTLYVVPPHARHKDRVARLQLGALPRSERLTKAWVPVEVGIGEIHDADRLPAGCRVERARIQVEDLLGRKERETAPTDRTTSKIVGRIVVARGNRARPDPNRRCGLDTPLLESEIVFSSEAR